MSSYVSPPDRHAEFAQSFRRAAESIRLHGEAHTGTDQTVIVTINEALLAFSDLFEHASRLEAGEKPLADNLKRLLAQYDEAGSTALGIADSLVDGSFDTAEDRLADLANDLVRLLERASSHLQQVVVDLPQSLDAARQFIHDWPYGRVVDNWTYYDSVRIRHRAEEIHSRAEAEATRQKLKALTEAQAELSSEFDQIAKREERLADLFRFLVVAIVGCLGLLGAYAPDSTTAWPERIAQTLVVTVPLLVLAGYVAREAGQHRRMGRWARVLSVQLKTVANYVAPLTEEHRSALLREFGTRVLGPLPDVSSKAGNGEDLTTALTIIQELASRMRTTSSS